MAVKNVHLSKTDFYQQLFQPFSLNRLTYEALMKSFSGERCGPWASCLGNIVNLFCLFTLITILTGRVGVCMVIFLCIVLSIFTNDTNVIIMMVH